jgi:CRP-like cAMP-binding protein
VDKTALLRSVPLFADLDTRSLDAVGVLAKEVEARAGEVLMREGDPGDTFFVIVDGTVRVQRAVGAERFLWSGGFLGEIALLEGGTRTATATCETDCRLVRIERHEFERLLASFPHIARRVQHAGARRPHGHAGDSI